MSKPFDRFMEIISKAKQELPDTWNNMALATVNDLQQPSVRYVLLKLYDESGLTFFSNYTSRKAEELATNSSAAVVFYWPTLGMQLRIEGTVCKTTEDISNNYYAQRDRTSKIGAWVSKQSSMIPESSSLSAEIEEGKAKFAQETDIPRPNYWGGYKLTPSVYEFWHQGDARLHSRERYTLKADYWHQESLYP
ncbi:MAG: pyridoxamine 5'-phosphate oxidase [Francisellaceae bacterium]|jgi:pyridoxamine-phosphate oxidase|nr:pyridoxamine 5'-phosphate oxidase [Francisellaceae bacterium]MBT6538218.1 pyridoxamine 5'-phosphate oxidase [Francisellaceae bacterium]